MSKKTIKKLLFPLVKPFKYRYIYLKDYFNFKKINKNNNRFKLSWRDKQPHLYDKSDYTGFDPHYLFHQAWAARILAEKKPEEHIDISSVLLFSIFLSAFMKVKFYDIRPPKLNLDNFKSNYADLTNLPFESNSIKSLSCMHAIEHVGLGRYGDEIDPDGDLKAMSELKRVLAVDGDLLIVVPIGQPKIEFNAHRIYSYDMIFQQFKDLRLEQFALIKDKGDRIIYNAAKEMADKENYACGCFWFKK